MNTTEILSAISEEISRLTQVRSLLGGLDTAVAVPKRLTPDTAPRRGRPKGSKNKATSFNPSEFSSPKRRTMTPEGKARIAAAQRARWARQHAEVVTPKPQKRSAAVAKARLSSPAKTSSKAALVRKGPTPVNRAAAEPATAKKPKRVKAAPATSATPSRTRVATKKIALNVAGGSQKAKGTPAKSSQPKAARPRTAPRKTPVSSKAASQTETLRGGTSESSTSGE